MIFLDANALYSYYGRSRLGMSSSPVDENVIGEYLDRQKNKSIPTSVYIEILTHFRDDPKKQKALLKFIKAKGIRFYNNIPDYIINPDELMCVEIMDEHGLREYTQNVLKKKIEIECKFTALFYEVTRDLYAHYKIESAHELSEDNKESLMFYIGKSIYEERGKEFAERIRAQLSSGYEEGKEQNTLKEFYIQELNEACLLIDVLVAGAVACKAENSDIIDGIQSAYQEAVDKGLDGQNGTMPYIVDTLTSNCTFLEMSKGRISSMFKKGHYSENQVAYMRDIMFEAWFNRGQKLKKNDIFDMLCAGCFDCPIKDVVECVLVDSSHYILSFDKTMKSFIGAVKPANLHLIEKLQNGN